MHLPEIDKYAGLDSPVHRWDPRVKLATMAPLVLATVLAPGYAAALAGLGAALLLLALSRIPPSFALTHLRWVLLLCAFLTVVLGLTPDGEPLWQAGGVALSREGLWTGGLISVRATAAVLLLLVAMGTARVHVTLKALRRLRVPSVVVQILGFSYRYVFVLFDELRRMLSAARARGHGRARGLRALHNVGSMLGMLIVRSVERTRRVRQAMLARGYRGEMRTLEQFRLRRADLAKGAAALAACAGLIALEVAG